MILWDFNFAGEIQTLPKWKFYGFLGWMAHSKTVLLTGALCENVYFFDISNLFMILWDLANVLR